MNNNDKEIESIIKAMMLEQLEWLTLLLSIKHKDIFIKEKIIEIQTGLSKLNML